MQLISAEHINQTSPYRVTQVDDEAVRFVTDFGVRYMIGFSHDIFIYEENGYFMYITNESPTDVKDPKIAPTVVAIIADLFYNCGNAAMLYICSIEEHRQASRARLFARWFNHYAPQDVYSLKTYQSVDKNGIEYFYGLILQNANPNYENMVEAFYDFLKDQ